MSRFKVIASVQVDVTAGSFDEAADKAHDLIRSGVVAPAKSAEISLVTATSVTRTE